MLQIHADVGCAKHLLTGWSWTNCKGIPGCGMEMLLCLFLSPSPLPRLPITQIKGRSPHTLPRLICL